MVFFIDIFLFRVCFSFEILVDFLLYLYDVKIVGKFLLYSVNKLVDRIIGIML